jgi:hypothetical protein
MYVQAMSIERGSLENEPKKVQGTMRVHEVGTKVRGTSRIQKKNGCLERIWFGIVPTPAYSR